MATEQPDIPSFTCRERSGKGLGLGLVVALNGAAWIAALGLGLSIPGAVTLGLVSLATLGLTFRAWRRRRIALRVDSTGLHEVFADGRTVTHPWAELRERPIEELGWVRWLRFLWLPLDQQLENHLPTLSQWLQRYRRLEEKLNPMLHLEMYPGATKDYWADAHKVAEGSLFLFESPVGRVVIRDQATENGRGLVAFIRAALRGERPASPPQLAAPTRAEIAAWLGVSPEDLPVTFPIKWKQMALITLFFSAFYVACGLMLREPSWFKWVALGVGIFWTSAFFLGICLGFPYVKVDVDGLLSYSGFGPERRCAWEDLIELDGLIVRSRYQDFLLRPDLDDGKRLQRLIQRVLDARGDLPPAALEPGLPVPNTALSKAQPSTQPEAGEKSLSQAETAEEDKPRLTGEEAMSGQEVPVRAERPPDSE